MPTTIGGPYLEYVAAFIVVGLGKLIKKLSLVNVLPENVLLENVLLENVSFGK